MWCGCLLYWSFSTIVSNVIETWFPSLIQSIYITSVETLELKSTQYGWTPMRNKSIKTVVIFDWLFDQTKSNNYTGNQIKTSDKFNPVNDICVFDSEIWR